MSRAAERLHVSQPAVSRQIRDLEEELGVELFERTHSGLKLTEAGYSALAHAREVLRQTNAMVETMQSFRDAVDAGSLRIAFIPTALPSFLADSLRTFRGSHPEVCVQLKEMTPSDQEQALRDDEVDLALLGHACPELQKRYRVEPIREVAVGLALPDDHALAKRKTVDLTELVDETFLTLNEEHFPGRLELMARAFQDLDATPHVTRKVDGLTELLGLVGSGAGVALVPADLDRLPHPRVALLKLKHPRMTLVSSAVWKADKEGPALLALIDILKADT